ncbi:MAG: methylated-DNA--[protein]-cysteine S-methyltransferase [Campylobacter sp.]
MQKAYFNSPIGILEIIGDQIGVCNINFVSNFIKINVEDENIKLCLNELERYFRGELKIFKTKINIKSTGFTRQIHEELLKIPYASTITYAQLAKNAGKPRAYRAAGTANSKNKIPILVPCHRVVSANGLGGYSGAKGIETKKFLLNLEKNNCN